MNDSVIHLEGVTKVFLTDEVETHALAGVRLRSGSASQVPFTRGNSAMVVLNNKSRRRERPTTARRLVRTDIRLRNCRPVAAVAPRQMGLKGLMRHVAAPGAQSP